jgi:hypothetical protein
MNKLNTILAALLIVGVAACSSNSDKNLHIAGKWTLTGLNLSYSGTTTVDDQTQPVNVTAHAINLDEDDYMIFGEDHAFTSSLNEVV